MPRLMPTDKDQVIDIPGPGNFQFSAVRPEELEETEYTLVTIVCDISGSVLSFKDELLESIKSIIKACQKSPRAERLLVRLLTFNRDIYEIHGFKELSDIDPDAYDPLSPDSVTSLFDASYDGISATLEYARRLVDQDFDCNGAVYIITDGDDNYSTLSPSAIKDKMKTAVRNEEIESLITILIGLTSPGSQWEKHVKDALERFKTEADLTEFVDVGEATPQKLAKLANFVSQSISSQSQALGTGAPSQSLQF